MTFFTRAGAFFLLITNLPAGEAPAADPDLPQPVDGSFAEELVMNSPFTRAVNLQETLQLTGIASIDGHPIAMVFDKETKQRFVVSEEPNALGWTLVAASAGEDLDQTYVDARIGAEVVAMQYQGQLPAAGDARSRLAGTSKKDKDDGKSRTSSFLGEGGRELYASLSPEARNKFKELMKSLVEKHPKPTPEQNADYARKVFAKIKAADGQSAAGSTAKPAKSGRPPKNKQGA